MDACNQDHVSQRLASELATLFYYHPPRTLSRNLRKMFMDYVEGELTVGVPDYFDELAPGLNWLFNFLDIAEEEIGVLDVTQRPEMACPVFARQAVDSLEGIVQFIVALLRPERIYSLKYDDPLRKEEASYYDLLIIMPDAAQTPFKSYETLIELCCFNNSHVRCSLHQSATLCQYITAGNLFYSTMCIDKNIVYDNGTNLIPAPDPGRLEAAKEEARKVFTAGYNKASSFMEGAKGYFDKGAYDISAFMLQQAAELVLRGVILGYTGKDVRTHSITELLKNCKRVAPQLSQILPGSDEDERGLLGMLETAYLNARYQEQYNVNADDLGALMKRVGVLMDKANVVFNFL